MIKWNRSYLRSPHLLERLKRRLSEARMYCEVHCPRNVGSKILANVLIANFYYAVTAKNDA